MAAIVVLFFIVGSIFGSFLNVVIDRLIVGQSILGRSYCDYCKRTLTALDLVPILSYIFLKGRCRVCKKRLSLQYPVIEGLTGALFAMVVYMQAAANNLNPTYLFYLLALACVMVIVATVDFKYSLIPTAFVFGASLFSLFYNFFTLPSDVFVTHVAAAFAAAIFFGAIVLFTKGRGMGSGDIVLAFLIGMVLGFEKMILSVFLAFIIGSIIAILLIIFGRKGFRQTIPFGPFLVIGFYLSFYWFNPLLAWYLNFF